MVQSNNIVVVRKGGEWVCFRKQIQALVILLGSAHLLPLRPAKALTLTQGSARIDLPKINTFSAISNCSEIPNQLPIGM